MVTEYQLIEILPSVPISHRKALAVFPTILNSQPIVFWCLSRIQIKVMLYLFIAWRDGKPFIAVLVLYNL